MTGLHDAVSLPFLGGQVYAYGLFVAAGCLLGAGLLLFLCRAEEKCRNFSAISCLLSPVLGLVCARLVWGLAEVNFAPFLSLKNLLRLDGGGFAMFGALLGACLGGLIAARLAGLALGFAMDRQLAAMMLFVAAARLGEGTTALGISRPLVTGVLDHSFLAFRDSYDAYLRTYLLESASALIICLVVLNSIKQRKPWGSFLLGLLAFGVTQNLWESLRYDGHLRFSFIGLQQVLAVVLFSLVLIWLAIGLMRSRKAKGLALASLGLLPVVLAAMLLLEFRIDRSETSKWLLYGLYVLASALPLWLGLRMIDRSGYNDQRQG